MAKYDSMWDRSLERISVTKHRIYLPSSDARPVHSSPYRAGPCQSQQERDEVDKMRTDEVAERATTKSAAPVEFAPKKDGSHCFCVVYRRPNAMKIRDSYPIAEVDGCTDSSGKVTMFSTLGAKSGYWQIEMDDKNTEKTAM